MSPPWGCAAAASGSTNRSPLAPPSHAAGQGRQPQLARHPVRNLGARPNPAVRRRIDKTSAKPLQQLGSEPSPPRRCRASDRPAPKARARCSAPQAARSSGSQTRSSPTLRRSYGPWPTARWSGNAAKTLRPRRLRTAPPTPQCSDDRPQAPCPPPANHGRPICQQQIPARIHSPPSQSAGNRISSVDFRGGGRRTRRGRADLWRG